MNIYFVFDLVSMIEIWVFDLESVLGLNFIFYIFVLSLMFVCKLVWIKFKSVYGRNILYCKIMIK